MLPWVCSVDHRSHQNLVKTSLTLKKKEPCKCMPVAHSCATSLFLTHFDIIWDIFLNRRKAT